jgi:hypothetical protein
MSVKRLLIAAFPMAIADAASAQVTPAAGHTPPDDTPSMKVGATMCTDFTGQSNPTITDADGNTVNPRSFNLAQSCINALSRSGPHPHDRRRGVLVAA